MRRRDLLKAAALAAPLAVSFTVAGRLMAAPQNSARLLVVFLRGAYDATNVVVPIHSDFYYASRPTLAIAKPDPANADSAKPLTADWGLHPALADTILPLWTNGQCAFVPFAGTDDMSRSHFETQDTIEMGQPLSGSRNYGSGFMSRLAGQLSGVTPIAFTDQMPLIFRGGAPIPNVAINQVAKPGVDARQAKLIEGMYQGQALAPAVKEGFTVRDEVYSSMSQEMTAASRGAVSPKGFELSARRIARLMQTQFNLGFVDVGGWDTHVNQGGAQGYLAARLTELGRGLAGFADEIGPADWNKTTVVVISEFGRTFHENGDHGTDHGHGGAFWVLGGAIKGRRIVGRQVELVAANLNQSRDYPVLNEYRAVLGGLFARLYGLPSNRLQAVFPQTQPTDLALA
jgi:uncharacterized protein (DUF1501 family)